jgi:hypothetical protein
VAALTKYFAEVFQCPMEKVVASDALRVSYQMDVTRKKLALMSWKEVLTEGLSFVNNEALMMVK